MSDPKPENIALNTNENLDTNTRGGLVLELRVGDGLIFNEEFLVEVTEGGFKRIRLRCFSEDPKKYKIRRIYK